MWVMLINRRLSHFVYVLYCVVSGAWTSHRRPTFAVRSNGVRVYCYFVSSLWKKVELRVRYIVSFRSGHVRSASLQDTQHLQCSFVRYIVFFNRVDTLYPFTEDTFGVLPVRTLSTQSAHLFIRSARKCCIVCMCVRVRRYNFALLFVIVVNK